MSTRYDPFQLSYSKPFINSLAYREKIGTKLYVRSQLGKVVQWACKAAQVVVGAPRINRD